MCFDPGSSLLREMLVTHTLTIKPVNIFKVLTVVLGFLDISAS